MTSSPRVGVVRASMRTNPLIIKAPLGRSQSRGLSVPGPGFTFGTSSSVTDGGVAEILSSWRVPPRREDLQHPSFVSLNREAVKSGLVTSKQLSQYRAVKTQNSTPRPRGPGASRRPLPVPHITFGVPNRAPSPISDLLSHLYAQRWLDQQLARNRTSQNQNQNQKVGPVKDTRTSILRRSQSLPGIHAPKKTLKHVSQVGPALETFRDPGARLRAFRTHQGKTSDMEKSGPDGELKTRLMED
ncbi:cilia- and flagella-associated protein 77 [Pholidichthys leucotaenia]